MKRALALLVVLGGARSLAHADHGHSSCGKGSWLDLLATAVDLAAEASRQRPERTEAPQLCRGREVHGYRRCSRFGDWGRAAREPRMVVEVGSVVRSWPSALRSRQAAVTHDSEQFAYRVVDPRPSARPTDTAVAASMRIAAPIARGAFVAGEGELGALIAPATRAEMTTTGERGTPEITQTAVTVASGQVVAGWRGRSGNFTLGFEAAGGLRVVSYHYDSHYHACETSVTLHEPAPVLEARTRATWWTSPFFALSMTVGRSLIDHSWMAGATFGVASRAFGD